MQGLFLQAHLSFLSVGLCICNNKINQENNVYNYFIVPQKLGYCENSIRDNGNTSAGILQKQG